MAIETKFVSRYDHRVELVRDAVKSHSKLNSKDATDLAIHVLHALDKIPESIR